MRGIILANYGKWLQGTTTTIYFSGRLFQNLGYDPFHRSWNKFSGSRWTLEKKKKKKLNWIKKKKRVLHVARTQKHDAVVCVWWWEMLFLHRFWWKCLKYNTLNRKRSWLPASTNIYLPFPVTPHLFYLWGIHPKYQAPTKVDICSLPSQPPGRGELQNLCAGILLDVVKSTKSWI